MPDQIRYKEGYKYQLVSDYRLNLGFKPPFGKISAGSWLHMYSNGDLLIKAGYAWDGPSGLTIDTKSSMRPSLVHDAGYQLIRWKLLPINYRKKFDDLFRQLCLDDGMPEFRADVWAKMVKAFAASAADPINRKPVLTAP